MNEYATLNKALKAMRENFLIGDLSGFETHQEFVSAIRAMERRMFEIVASA